MADTVVNEPYIPTMADMRDKAIRIKDSQHLYVKFDDDDKIPPCVRKDTPEIMLAMETKGDGACGMHAVFGHPDANRELSLPNARNQATLVSGPYQPDESASNSRIFATSVQSSLWHEFALSHLAENPCTEAKLFWQTMSEMSPGLAEDSRHIYDMATESQSAVAALKTKAVRASRPLSLIHI